MTESCIAEPAKPSTPCIPEVYNNNLLLFKDPRTAISIVRSSPSGPTKSNDKQSR